jgi:hypothetical protein
MELPAYDLKTLFDQLGLPSENEAIDDFIEAHPLDANTKLIDAEFWTPQQAQPERVVARRRRRSGAGR